MTQAGGTATVNAQHSVQRERKERKKERNKLGKRRKIEREEKYCSS